MVMGLEMLIPEESKLKASPSSNQFTSRGYSPATSETKELAAILLVLYRRVHLVCQLDFSLVLHLLKVMGEFKVINDSCGIKLSYHFGILLAVCLCLTVKSQKLSLLI